MGRVRGMQPLFSSVMNQQSELNVEGLPERPSFFDEDGDVHDDLTLARKPQRCSRQQHRMSV